MSTARPDALSLVGKLVGGRFRVVQHLGSGGAGHVYLAERDGPARTRVALKVLRPEHRRGAALARFKREALAAARVHHPNVLEILEVHVDGPDVPFFAMELLVGLDLADTLSYARVLSSARAARVALGAADGLLAAHEQGVVHGDVKPENLFLVHAPDGRELVKLVDFGFARLEDDEGPPSGSDVRKVAVGTPEYMSPEQALGVRGDPRSDVYSLGVVLYEMLAGRAPFVGSFGKLLAAHAHEPPPDLHELNPALVASEAIEALVTQALQKDPSARFATMAAFRRALASTPEATVRLGPRERT